MSQTGFTLFFWSTLNNSQEPGVEPGHLAVIALVTVIVQ